MKLSKRLLAILLCLAMMLTMLPAQVFSLEGTPKQEAQLQSVGHEETANSVDTEAGSFVFIEPGKENDEPVGDIVITDQGYRVQKNPDLQSYTILEYLGTERNVVIPSEYQGLPITRIASYAFRNKVTVRTVRIPETVERMEQGVFDGCTALVYHIYENGKYLGSENNAYYYYCGPVDEVKSTVTEGTMHPDTEIVAAFAFSGCEALRSAVVPDGVKQVGYGMLRGCEPESITLPFVGELGTNKNPQFGWVFGARSFGGNISYVPMSLKAVTITGGAGGSRGTIAQGAFYGVDMIEEITLPFLGGDVYGSMSSFLSWYWGANGYTANILPATLKKVTILQGKTVPDYAFYSCSALETIVVPKSAKSIGKDAFYGCSSLKNITIPEGVTSIGFRAFCQCESLESITIPEGVQTIEPDTFRICRKLKRITIPASVTAIEENAFYSCDRLEALYISDLAAWCRIQFRGDATNPLSMAQNLYLDGEPVTDLRIPEEVTAIGSAAFKNCTGIKHVTVPEGVTTIEADTFSGCSGLESITLPGGITAIGNNAFSGCSSLKSIRLPSEVKTVGKYAFANCSALESIAIPEGVTTVAQETFSDCVGLMELTLPDSVTAIEYRAFYGCSSLRRITLPKGVTTVGYDAFSGCSLYKVTNNSQLTLTVGSADYGSVARNAVILVNADGTVSYLNGSSGYEYVETEEDFLFQKYNGAYKLVAYLGHRNSVTLPLEIEGNTYHIFKLRGVRDVIIPEGMTTIHEGAFYDCKTLESITIPESVTAIGSESFTNCSALKNIVIPDQVTSIGFRAFMNCTALESVRLPQGLKTVYYETFSGCSSLRDVTVPDGVTTISSQAFKGCTSLENVYIFDVAAWCSIAFYHNEANPLLYAKNLFVNGTLRREVTVPDSVAALKKYTFCAPYALDQVNLGANVKFVADCFDKSIHLNVAEDNPHMQMLDGVLYNKPATRILHVTHNATSVVLPEGITAVPYNQFYGCSNLQSIIIPQGVTSIGSSAFYGCSSLESIALPEGITTISSTLFYNCKSLKSITIPQSVTSIESSAFYGCKSLESLAVPAGVTQIGMYAFADCTNLKTITLPEGIGAIGAYWFYACRSLENIVLPQSVTEVKENAFNRCSALKSITLPAGVTAIGKGAFTGCSSLESIVLPKNITAIEQDTFSDCSSLKTVLIPNGVTVIGQSAFGKCMALESVVIPEGVTTIGQRAFDSCAGLKALTIGTSVTTIGNYAFYNCSALEEITVPGQVTSLGRYAFCGCTGLKSAILAEGVTAVSENAFSGCKNLKNVVLPESVTTVGAYAFYNCTRLTGITIPGNTTAIGSYAFYGCTGLYKVINKSALALTVSGSGNGYAAYYARVLEKPDGSISYRNEAAGYRYVETAEGFLFERINESNTLIAYLGYEDTVPLPLQIDGKAYGIYQMKGVRNVVLPAGTTTIDNGAFYQSDLKSISIPEGLTSIGRDAFVGCSDLEYITLPDSLTSIGDQAFWGCGLNSICVKGMVTIGTKAFSDCQSLHTVVLSGIENLEESVFSGCTNLTQLRYEGERNEWRHVLKSSGWDDGMPECAVQCTEDTGILYETDAGRTEFYISGVDDRYTTVAPAAVYSGRPVKAVLSNAFLGSKTLESVHLPETVEYVGEKAFINCSALKEIQFPAGLKRMEQGVLAGCEALEELNLPFLGSSASSNQNAYLSYTFGGYGYRDNPFYIPDNLTRVTVSKAAHIIDHAFENCAGLQKIILPATVRKIGSYAFAGCTRWEPEPLPEALEELGEYAFSDCEGILRMELPEKLTRLQNHTFAGCVNLEQLSLPENMQTVGSYAFSGCVSLEEISLNPKLTEIGDYGFQNCESLKTLTLPDSVQKVGVMLLDGCNTLTQIRIGAGLRYDGIADTHDRNNSNPIFGIDKSASRLNAYTVSEENPDFVARDNILYRKMNVDGQAVEVEIVDAPAKANLRNYHLPEGIVKIGAYAFAYNNTLRTIDLEYVRMLGNNAFYKAENLIYAQFGMPSDPMTLPEGVQEICYHQYVGREAFAGCTSLQRVNLDSEMLLGIEESAFADCRALRTVYLGKNIRHIGIGAFGSSGSGVPALESIHVVAENPCFESIDGVLYQRKADGTLTLLVYPSQSSAYEVKDGKNVFSLPAESVTGVESYAFRMAQHLDEIRLEPQQDLKVGDYAFANTMLERVYLGQNVVSLGLKRGEGEYTVFAGCNYLVAIETDANNRYYSSRDGVLFNINATRLIKYPTAKTGNVYRLPDTVNTVASMAFKNNNNLQYVHICSAVDTVGLEAFYGCSNLEMIFFDRVYAPTSVLENAFTTYDSLNENHIFDPGTQLGYSQGYYSDGADGEYGWNNYQDVYNLALCEALPESEGRTGNDFYGVVVVDSQGNRLNGLHVTLSDPTGTSETVSTGQKGAASGVATFYDLFSSAGMGFSLVTDGTYSLQVSDPTGEYFTYANPAFCLDQDMRITYITVAKVPGIYGTTCGETDINTESAEINKAQYGYTNVELIDESLGYVEGNLKTTEQSEYLDISVISYCDSRSGWSFVDTQGKPLDPQIDGLYQNGVKICDVTSVQVQDRSVLFGFRVDVAKLMPEIQIEARLKAFNADGTAFVCATVLNIHVFDFVVTEDDVELDTQEMEIDLAGENATLAKLFGSPAMDVKLGENLSFHVAVDGSRVEMTLTGQGEKELKKVTNYPSFEEGYEDNHGAHNKNTYFFQFKDTYKDKKGVRHELTYNVRFARGTEKSNYFYYRCYVYEGDYNNEVAKFYGAVNGLSDVVSKAVGAKTLRERVAPKAFMIYKCHLMVANKEAKTVRDIAKLDESAQYMEAIENAPSYSNSHSLEVELSGKLVFEYDRKNGLKPVSSEIHGELYYTFKHNSQFVVWVIPVVLEVEVKVGGEVDITLKFDKDRGVALEEAKLTLQASISAKVGVGCSVASLGVYGSLGTVFVLDFYPEFGVESWTLNGEIGAYMKILWYKKTFTIAKFKNYQLMGIQSRQLALAQSTGAMYLAENYSSEDLDDCDGNARILTVGDQIYRLSYVNAENRAGYDAYNFRKLALARWNGSDWDASVILDDNGRNDAGYDLYCSEDALYVVFTQQGQQLDQTSVDDTYASAANMTVKVAQITDLSKIRVSTVSEGGCYKYLPTVTKVADTLTVAWAENADNNMFGVSPYNYIDANHESHVFETTANAVYVSKLESDQWQTPTAVQTGLSAVTDLAAAEDGKIAYVIDGNGDLGDSDDRVLYTVDAALQAPNAVNQLERGSVTSVDAGGRGFAYYFSSNSEEASGLRSTAPDAGTAEQLSGITGFGEQYKLLYNADGSAAAVFYVALKSWEEAGTTVDGSALYAVFCNNGQWGLPVEIREIPGKADAYISSFDALYRTEDSVMVMAEFVDKDGEFLYRLTEDDISLESRISVTEHRIDYANRAVEITARNEGAKSGEFYVSVDGGARVLYSQNIGSGHTQAIVVSLKESSSMQPLVQVYDSEDGAAIYTVNGLDMEYSDLVPFAKQLLLGEDNHLLLGVKNTGTLGESGYLVVRPGNFDGETICAPELAEEAKRIKGADLINGEVVPVNHSDYGPFWVIKLRVASGMIQYYEILLTEAAFTGETELLSIHILTDSGNEKETAKDNNTVYVSYRELIGTLDEGEQIATTPKLYEDLVEWDSKIETELNIGFSCGAADNVRSVSVDDVLLSDQTDYSVKLCDGVGSLMIGRDVFEDRAAGDHQVVVTFAQGDSCALTVSIPEYHIITWIADGTELCTTEVKHGTMPHISSNPTRDSSETTEYAFIGWASDAAGSEPGIHVATEDETYYAVWGENSRVYQITWVFEGTNGRSVPVVERYSYNALPEFKGKILTPDEKTFAGWDQNVTLVTGNKTYTAVYEAKTVVSKVPTLTLKAPALEFKDMIKVIAFFTAENIDDVVEMGMITYTEQVDVVDINTANHVIPGAEYEAATNRYFASSQGIFAKYLGDTVYLACYAKLTDGSYVYTKLAPYSPITYATNQLKNSTNTQLKQLVAAMLNYSTAAQVYFNYSPGKPANGSMTDEQKALPEAFREDMVTAVPAASAEKQGIFANNKGFSVRKPAISFEGAFSINYFFTPAYAPVDGITLYYWTEADYAAAEILTVENASGSVAMNGTGLEQYRGDIEGIAAKNLDQAVYVAAVYSDGTTTWTSGILGYSIGAYCGSLATKGGAMADLAMATAVYGYHAKQYFG